MSPCLIVAVAAPGSSFGRRTQCAKARCRSIKMHIQVCCQLRAELAAVRQDARNERKELESKVQDAKLANVTLQAQMDAANGRAAASDAEVQRLIQVAPDLDMAHAKLELDMQQLQKRAADQASAHEREMTAAQVVTHPSRTVKLSNKSSLTKVSGGVVPCIQRVQSECCLCGLGKCNVFANAGSNQGPGGRASRCS